MIASIEGLDQRRMLDLLHGAMLSTPIELSQKGRHCVESSRHVANFIARRASKVFSTGLAACWLRSRVQERHRASATSAQEARSTRHQTRHRRDVPPRLDFIVARALGSLLSLKRRSALWEQRPPIEPLRDSHVRHAGSLWSLDLRVAAQRHRYYRCSRSAPGCYGQGGNAVQKKQTSQIVCGSALNASAENHGSGLSAYAGVDVDGGSTRGG